MSITESTKGEVTTSEARFYISSLDADGKIFGNSVRSHWGIEASLHWVLDVAFREDECRIRKGYGAENLATVRHLALSLLKQETTNKRGIAVKRFKAALNTDYLGKVAFG